MLRWGVQHGTVVIPKSNRPERIIENSRIFDFELSGKDMAALDGLNEEAHTSWNPTTVR
jgi:diketogulonate reductase-like aldo/keto reductase